MKRILSAATLLVVFVLGGCSSIGGAAPQVDIVPNVAILDETAITVTLPLTSYMLTAEEQNRIARAQDLLLEECLDRAGTPSPMPNRLDTPVPVLLFSYYGPWVLDVAAQYGYDLPTSDRDSNPLSAWESDLSPSQLETAVNCMDSDQWRDLDITELMNLGASVRGERESYQWAEQTDAWKETLTQYRGCMVAAGYTFDEDSPFTPESATNASGEQEILIALEDVECKNQSDLVQRLSDVVAAFEVEFIASNEAALLEEDTAKKVILDRADAIISAKS